MLREMRGSGAGRPPKAAFLRCKIPQLQDPKFHNSASIDAFGYKLQSVESTPSNSADVIAGPEKARFMRPRLETRLASLAEPGDLSYVFVLVFLDSVQGAAIFMKKAFIR